MYLILLIVLVVVVVLATLFSIKDSYVPATEDDFVMAHDYAIRQMCRLKGYSVEDHSDGSFDCRHTESTCWRDSTYPAKDNKVYLEWDGQQCNLGLHPFRQFCEEQGLTYDPQNGGTCTTNCNYCASKLLPFERGDCYVDPVNGFVEKLFGKTLTRGGNVLNLQVTNTEACAVDALRIKEIEKRKRELKII